jgi:hypothetical protein
VTASTAVTNPNPGYGLQSFPVTFVAQDATGRQLGTSTVTVSVPPMAVVRAVVPDMRIHPKNAKVDSVVAQFGNVVWTPAGSFRGTGLQVEGAGLSSSGTGGLTVIASVSNQTTTDQSGRLICEIDDATGGLTGAVTARVSMKAGQGGPVQIPVPHPSPDARFPSCEIVPEGR